MERNDKAQKQKLQAQIYKSTISLTLSNPDMSYTILHICIVDPDKKKS